MTKLEALNTQLTELEEKLSSQSGVEAQATEELIEVLKQKISETEAPLFQNKAGVRVIRTADGQSYKFTLNLLDSLNHNKVVKFTVPLENMEISDG